MGKLNSIYKLVGPGIIWAATSIGVSHIVQSTRAGAEYGFSLLGIILLAHAIKYPFFQIGPQYAASTGESLLDGYKRLGNWAFYGFLALTFFTMFFVQAAVTIVTAALAINLFGTGLNLAVWSALILITVALVLILGKFKWLSESLKWMVMVLAILSITTLCVALNKYGIGQSELQQVPDLSTPMAIAFIVALIGWMPTSIEVSVWHSMWSIKRLKNISSKEERIRSALLDFRIGYVTSFILAVVFLWLGVIILFGHDFSFSQAAGKFAGQLVGVYTDALGDWSFGLIALICFIALFSTTFAVSD
ncbi:MAG: divalent metal cation transporter, partial [Kangiellaceae bacterium]|nr:divalent metal cation transporter [Kangiellaceae bacterium]